MRGERLSSALRAALLLCSSFALAAACGNTRDGGSASDATSDASIDVESLPLDDFVRAEMDAAKIPGLSAVIVKHGKVVWSGNYGFADLEKKTPVGPDTIFLLASISKTFTAVAAMQLVEQKKLSLDDDVSTHLPFSLRNPKHADVPITISMLLGHTSSIDESYFRLFSYFVAGDSPVQMEPFLRDFLLPGGKSYDAAVFGDETPGTKYSYSQVGPTAFALAFESVAGEPFDRYTDEKILAPLGMKDTSWRLASLDATRVAKPYTYFSTGEQRANDPWGVPFYPAATMKSTALELAKFLVSFIRTPDVTSARLISESTQTEMLRVQFPDANADGAVLWDWRTLADGSRIVGHTGGAPGVSTTMFFRPSDGVGVITLTNSDVHLRIVEDHDAHVAAYRAIEARLFREADRY